MSMLEACMLRTPIVCTAVGGLREVLDNEETALLVESDHDKELAEAFAKLRNSRDLQMHLANAAYDLFRKNFEIHKTNAQLRAVYEAM